MAITRKRSSCRVLAVDDHPSTLEAIGTILKHVPHIKLVGTAMDGSEAVQKHAALKPHVIIMDANMPGTSGIDATKEIRRKDRDVRILFYSGQSPALYAALAAGADGFLTKGSPIAHLLAAIESVWHGGIFIDRALWPAFQSRLVREDPTLPALTDEEKQVIPLLAAGHSSKQIAGKLGLKVRRVQKVRGRLIRKTHSLNSTALIAKLIHSLPPLRPEPTGI